MKSFGEEGDDLFLKELSDQIVTVFKDGEATEDIKWDEAAPKDVTLNEETPIVTEEGQEALEVKPETVEEKVVPATSVLVSIDTAELKTVLDAFLLSFTTLLAEFKAANTVESNAIELNVIAPTEDIIADEEPDPAPEAALKDIIGDEKMAELRELMVGESAQPKDFNRIKSMFDDMTKELTGIFSVQQ
jgi:hypothetical protein